ncbi:response regulator transcription factor [Paucibacter sp. APW11]|uniref:Response regulator transcription factor n=1 Tax=Roseateles aquae TaxID=3077235 RepID=A0ABU3P5Q9_9BURK|nr:response regulator transcription factor [Paucibacter sp. APW11]MDT8997900.1 response regulator transcription factor [Paucibacter sp. APW11]
MAVHTPTSTAPIKVLLADDHLIFREGLKLLLQASLPELQIVAETDGLTELKSLVQSLQPELLLLDYHMPGGDTAALLGYFRQRYPELKIVMLTGAQSPLLLRQLVDLGADAVLLKQGSGEELLASLRMVLAGGKVVTEAVQQRIEQASLALTPRELQVMKLIYDGLSNSEIAVNLSLSPKTVDKHRENLMRKMEVNNVTQLVKKVYALKLLETESPAP